MTPQPDGPNPDALAGDQGKAGGIDSQAGQDEKGRTASTAFPLQTTQKGGLGLTRSRSHECSLTTMREFDG